MEPLQRAPGSLPATKDEFLDRLLKMDQRIGDGLSFIQELHGKDVNLVMGQTGAGKSTIINAIVNGADSLDQRCGTYVGKTAIEYNDKTMFEIGDGAESKTQDPGFIPLEKSKKAKSAYVCDCPGFNDSNRYQEYAN